MTQRDANRRLARGHEPAATELPSSGPTPCARQSWVASIAAALRAGIGPLAHRAGEYPAVASLAITIGLFALVFLIFTPSFQTNDDPQMEMIAAGRGSGLSADEHLVFSNVLIGHLLKILYTVAPAIPWYGSYLLGIQVLAYATLLYCVMRPGFTAWRLTLFLLYFAAVGIFSINQLQFTAVAGLAAQCGLLALLTALRERSERPAARVAGLILAAVGLIFLGSLVRLACVVPVVIVACACAVGWLGWPRRRTVLVPAVATAAVCGALVCAAAAYNNAYYNRDPAWRAFWRYNALRLQFNDYRLIRYTSQTAPIFDAVHWTKNDYTLMLRWFYDDPAIYSEANLKHIVEATDWRTSREARDNLQGFFQLIVADRTLRPLLLLLPLFVWGRDRTTRAGRAACLGAAAACLLLVLLAVQTKPPPGRVYFQLMVLPLAMLLLAARDTMRLPRRRWPLLSVRCFFSPFSWSRPGARRLLAPTAGACRFAVVRGRPGHGPAPRRAPKSPHRARTSCSSRNARKGYRRQPGPDCDLGGRFST